MQSVNEELQSTNEELETSKEELQSVNEELATVNTELQTKVIDLSRTNNDMNNLLAGTGIGTVFVGHQLRILRFTPGGQQNHQPDCDATWAARWRTLCRTWWAMTRLVTDTQCGARYLDSQGGGGANHGDGKWYTLRIQPYRTLDNVIEGAVISFVDISETVKTRDALAYKANDLLRLAVVLRDAHDAITVQDLEGRTLAWNPGAAAPVWLERARGPAA
jgi:two-component system CheB/CheR fusion protein